MSRFDRVFALLGLIGIGALGGWQLLDLRARADTEWTQTAYALIVLSVLTGLLAALKARGNHGARAFFQGLLFQAFGAMIVVALFMGGGVSIWTVGFWIVTAIGWLPTYCWVFFLLVVLFSFFPRERPADAKQDTEIRRRG